MEIGDDLETELMDEIKSRKESVEYAEKLVKLRRKQLNDALVDFNNEKAALQEARQDLRVWQDRNN
jgi:hypothetical protein